jgi:hypothetical protein
VAITNLRRKENPLTVWSCKVWLKVYISSRILRGAAKWTRLEIGGSLRDKRINTN